MCTGKRDQALIRTGKAHQADIGGFTEGDAELGAGNRVDDGFLNIFHGFDEVGLSQDEIELIGIVDRDGFHFHGIFSLVKMSLCRQSGRR